MNPVPLHLGASIAGDLSAVRQTALDFAWRGQPPGFPRTMLGCSLCLVGRIYSIDERQIGRRDICLRVMGADGIAVPE